MLKELLTAVMVKMKIIIVQKKSFMGPTKYII